MVDIENGEEVTIKYKVTIDGEGIKIDYGGSSPQVKSAVNCTLSLSSYTTFAVNAALDLPIKINEALRVLTIKSDPGTILNCIFLPQQHAIGNHLAEIVYCAVADAILTYRFRFRIDSNVGQYLFGKKQDGTPFAPLNCINVGWCAPGQ